MKLTTLAGAVLALALVTGSAAALPGAAPAQADETASETDTDSAQAERDAGDTNESVTDEGAADDPAADRGKAPADAADGDRGPPASLPDQVPDFVGEIHQLVGDMRSGEFTGDLGDAISDLTPADDDAESGSNSTATPSA